MQLGGKLLKMDAANKGGKGGSGMNVRSISEYYWSSINVILDYLIWTSTGIILM